MSPPLYHWNLLGAQFISEDPLYGGVRRSYQASLVNNVALLDPLRSVQFYVVNAHCPVWTAPSQPTLRDVPKQMML